MTAVSHYPLLAPPPASMMTLRTDEVPMLPGGGPQRSCWLLFATALVVVERALSRTYQQQQQSPSYYSCYYSTIQDTTHDDH